MVGAVSLGAHGAEPSGPEVEAAEGGAASQGPWRAPRHRIFYRSVTAASVNSEGLASKLDLGYRYRLFDSDSILTRDSFVGLALAPMVTPIFAQIGVAAQAQPLAVLYLEARWKTTGWFGNRGHVQTFSDGTEDFSDDRISDLGESDETFSTTSWEAELTAELRARVGPVVVRNRTMFIRSELTPPQRPGDTLYYDPIYDLLMPTSGWSSTNDADLLLMLRDDRLIVGVRHTMRDAHRDDAAADVPTHRVGPLVAYRLSSDPGARFDAPTLVTMIQWHAKHRYRAGSAMPYVLVAFAFQGDLLDAVARP